MSLIRKARTKINKIDKKMIILFEKRMQAVDDVLKYKKEHNLAVFDKKREDELIKKNMSLVKDDLKVYYLELYEAVLTVSKKYQEEHYE